MQAFYDNKPSKLEAIGNGSFAYRYNIQEVEKPAQSDNTEAAEQAQTQWACEEVIVWSPLSANKITEKVLTEKFENNFEQKLVNEYNAAQLGLYGAKSGEEAKKRIQAYTDFLTERAALKSQVDADCVELGIK